MKRLGLVILSMALILGLTTTCYADDKKIKSVSVKFNAEDTYGNEIDATTGSTKYSVESCEILESVNDGYNEADLYTGPGAKTGVTPEEAKKATAEVVTTVEVTLTAEDGYVFYGLTSSGISVSGFDAKCTKAERQNSGANLILTVELPGIKTLITPVETATFEGCTAVWDAPMNAATYEVKLYRGSSVIGQMKETSGTKIDFAPLMRRAGSYSYAIVAKNAKGEASSTTRSMDINISEATASANKALYAPEYTNADAATPDVKREITNGGWQQSNGKWWYRLNDGSYPQNAWVGDGGRWYFFDGDGYMIANTSITWKGTTYNFGTDGACTNP